MQKTAALSAAAEAVGYLELEIAALPLHEKLRRYEHFRFPEGLSASENRYVSSYISSRISELRSLVAAGDDRMSALPRKKYSYRSR